MLNQKRIIVVLPAYRAAKTLERTYVEIPQDVVDDVILVDDASDDDTVNVAKRLGIKTIIHPENKGYGANQKTCYDEALKAGADIIVMLHPDYQYSPKLAVALASMIAYGEYDLVLGSRILVKGALKGGMPFYKYVANRLLTFIENILLDIKLSEYHTGYRAFSREVLETVAYRRNSNGFVFDNQIIAQTVYHSFRIGEISCPAKYFKEASTIKFFSSIYYGCGVLITAIKFFLQKNKICNFNIFKAD